MARADRGDCRRDEIDPPRNRISWISLAGAPLKAREGDTVVLRGPEGDGRHEILEVQYLALDSNGRAR